MKTGILITQCLQNDFIQPVNQYDPLPNRLHIGSAEATRLMGENPRHSPVNRTIRRAYAQPPEHLVIIHIRDWHNAGDTGQQPHPEQFGSHCLGRSGLVAAAYLKKSRALQPQEQSAVSAKPGAATPLKTAVRKSSFTNYRYIHYTAKFHEGGSQWNTIKK